MFSIENIILYFLIFLIAVSMTMVGKGGGNFYVLILIFAGISIHQSAAIGQFILFAAASMAMIVFGRNKTINWKLASIIGVLVAVSAFTGGFLSYLFDEFVLKLIFAGLLVLSGIIMIVPFSEREAELEDNHFGVLRIDSIDGEIIIDLKLVLPISLFTGFFSGMIGVSGGSFLVPMLVVACNIPMRSSVAIVTPLIAVSALMGFFGHFLQGHFDLFLGLPLMTFAVIGGFLGGRFALKSRPKNLKQLFALSNMLAALLILLNLISTYGFVS